MNQVLHLKQQIPINSSCRALGIARATAYRSWSSGRPESLEIRENRRNPRALSLEEETAVLNLLHSERFKDRSPAEVYATLLDENSYYCSVRTIYRILAKHGETTERRNIVHHGRYQKPELLATGPNQVWSWDITQLHGPQKWNYFYLYVLMDIFSRYVVGWMVADRESGE